MGPRTNLLRKEPANMGALALHYVLRCLPYVAYLRFVKGR